MGVNYSQRLASDESAHGNGGVGLTWRIGHSKEGWGWNYGLGWFVTDLDRSVAGRTLPFGELKVRPIVGGYGYTRKISDRWFVNGDLVGGVAFTSFSLTEEASDALRREAQAAAIGTHVGAIPIIRPEVQTWYDINGKFGLTVGGWYAIARPKVTITTAAARETLKIRADTFSLTGGVVYRIF